MTIDIDVAVINCIHNILQLLNSIGVLRFVKRKGHHHRFLKTVVLLNNSGDIKRRRT